MGGGTAGAQAFGRGGDHAAGAREVCGTDEGSEASVAQVGSGRGMHASNEFHLPTAWCAPLIPYAHHVQHIACMCRARACANILQCGPRWSKTSNPTRSSLAPSLRSSVRRSMRHRMSTRRLAGGDAMPLRCVVHGCSCMVVCSVRAPTKVGCTGTEWWE